MSDTFRSISRKTIIGWLIALSLLAVSARIGAIVYLRAWEKPNAMEHRSLAVSLVNGWGFSFGDFGYYGPSSVQSPPFPLLLAGLFKVFGFEAPKDGSLAGANLAYLTVLIMNAIAGGILVWLTYSMTRTLGGTTLAALLSAAAVAIWPSQVYAARHVQAIAMISCLLVAMVTLFYKAARNGQLKYWLWFSIVGTVATLTEPVFLPALAISGLLILFWRGLDWNVRLRNAGVLLLTTFIVIGPWTLRNRIVHEKWVPIKGTFWVNVWKGNNDFATGTDRVAMTDENRQRVAKAAAKFNDSQLMEPKYDGERQYVLLDPSTLSRLHNQPEEIREGVFKELAVDWIKRNPQHYFRLCVVRLLKTLTIDWDNPKSENVVYKISRCILLGLAVAGLVAAWRQKWSLLWPGILGGTALLTYTLTVTAARFSIPFEPIELALGAAAVAVAFEGRRDEDREGLVASGQVGRAV